MNHLRVFPIFLLITHKSCAYQHPLTRSAVASIMSSTREDKNDVGHETNHCDPDSTILGRSIRAEPRSLATKHFGNRTYYLNLRDRHSIPLIVISIIKTRREWKQRLKSRKEIQLSSVRFRGGYTLFPRFDFPARLVSRDWWKMRPN